MDAETLKEWAESLAACTRIIVQQGETIHEQEALIKMLEADRADDIENWLREWCCLDHATIAYHRGRTNPDGSKCLGCRVEALEAGHTADLLDCAKKALDTFNDAATALGLLGHQTMAKAMLIAATYTAAVIAKAEGRA